MKDSGSKILALVSMFALMELVMNSSPQGNDGPELGVWIPEKYWGKYIYCGSKITGFKLRMDPKNVQSASDNTALNGLQLLCMDGTSSDKIEGNTGEWDKAWTKCNTGQHIIKFGVMKQHPGVIPEKTGDLLGATNIKATCSDGEIKVGTGWFNRGTWDSGSCKNADDLCGLRASIKPPQGQIDDTALNGIQLFCCQDLTTTVVTTTSQVPMETGPCSEMDTDYYSNDVGLANGLKTWKSCANLCAKSDSCFAWTYISHRYNGPIKSAIEQCKFKGKNWNRGRKKLIGAVSGTARCPDFVDVYVDQDKGSDNKACGGISSPCKSLEMGIVQVKEGEKIFLLGTYSIHKTITINKDLHIQGAQGPVVTSVPKLRTTFKTTRATSIVISSMAFVNCTTSGTLLYNEGKASRSSIKISNCSFIDSGGFILRNLQLVQIERCTFESKSEVASAQGSFRLVNITNIVIKDSTFRGINSLGKGGAIYAMHWDMFAIVSSNFTNNSAESHGGAVYASKGGILNVTDCSFITNIAGENGGAIYVLQSASLTMKRSYLDGNTAALNGGATYFRSTDPEISPLFETISCVFENNNAGMQGGGIALKGEMFGLVENCLLKNNSALNGGGVYMMSSVKVTEVWKIMIHNTTFIDNKGQLTGQAIYDYGNVDLYNVTIEHDHRTSTGDVYMDGYNITLGNIDMRIGSVIGTVQTNMVYHAMTVAAPHITYAKDVRVVCPVHFRVDAHSTVTSWYSMMNVRCHSCESGQYTILSPTLKLSSGSGNISVPHTECLPCELGASCTSDVTALDNYWGTNITTDRLSFWPCPQGYCCSSQTTLCETWKTCHERREGVLCGSCKSGYVQSYISGDCIPKMTECDTKLFIVFFVMMSFFYSVLFTFAPTVSMKMKNVLVTKLEKLKDIDIRIQTRNTDETKERDGHPPLSIGAFVTVLILFYQISSLVHVEVSKIDSKIPAEKALNSDDAQFSLTKALFGFSNLHLSLSKRLCPFENLTLLSKEFIKICLKMSTIVNLFIFLIFYGILKMFRCFFDRISINRNVNDTVAHLNVCHQNVLKAEQTETVALRLSSKENVMTNEATELCVPSLLKIGFVKLLKLNFTSVCKFSFEMVHCVSVLDQFHLYVYGDYVCYKQWQYIILLVVLPTLLLIPISFSKSLDLLEKGLISTSSFLIATAVPAYCMFLYLKNQLHGLNKVESSKEEESCREAILDREEYLFRYYNTNNKEERKDEIIRTMMKCKKPLLRWPVVQLYRIILIVVLKIFILTPIYRSLAFATVFAGFIAHDWYEKPYAHPYLNTLQLLSSTCHLLVTICNNPSSVSHVADITNLPHTGSVINSLQAIETFMYVLVPCSLPLWFVWQRYGAKIKGLVRMILERVRFQ